MVILESILESIEGLAKEGALKKCVLDNAEIAVFTDPNSRQKSVVLIDKVIADKVSGIYIDEQMRNGDYARLGTVSVQGMRNPQYYRRTENFQTPLPFFAQLEEKGELRGFYIYSYFLNANVNKKFS